MNPSPNCASGPPCGPVCCNERVEVLLKEVQPQLQTLKEKINTVSPSDGIWRHLRSSCRNARLKANEPKREKKGNFFKTAHTLFIQL